MYCDPALNGALKFHRMSLDVHAKIPQALCGSLLWETKAKADATPLAIVLVVAHMLVGCTDQALKACYIRRTRPLKAGNPQGVDLPRRHPPPLFGREVDEGVALGTADSPSKMHFIKSQLLLTNL